MYISERGTQSLHFHLPDLKEQNNFLKEWYKRMSWRFLFERCFRPHHGHLPLPESSPSLSCPWPMAAASQLVSQPPVSSPVIHFPYGGQNTLLECKCNYVTARLKGLSVALQRNPQLLNKLGKLFKALFSLSDLLSPHFILLSPNFNSDALDILNFQVLKEVLFPSPLSLWTALPAA